MTVGVSQARGASKDIAEFKRVEFGKEKFLAR